jgi:hypothetical protein
VSTRKGDVVVGADTASILVVSRNYRQRLMLPEAITGRELAKERMSRENPSAVEHGDLGRSE